MRTFKIEKGDIVFDEKRSIVMVEGDEEEAQSIERLLTTNLGEWFLNPDFGLDYEIIQTKGVTDDRIRVAVITALSQEERIEQILHLEIERDIKRRIVEVTAICSMKSGNFVEVVSELG